MKTHPKTNVLKITRLLKITLIEKDFVQKHFFSKNYKQELFSLKNINKNFVAEASFSLNYKNPNGEKSGEFEYSPTALNDLGHVR